MLLFTPLLASTLLATFSRAHAEIPPDAAALRVCFSPKEECRSKILEFITSATKSLDIAVYEINDVAFSRPIYAQSQKIKVRVLTDQIEGERPQSAIARMAQAGVEIRYGQQAGIFHDNFIIKDGEVLETGSFNLTDHSAASNRENQIYLTDPATIARYQAEFDDAWATAKPYAPAEGGTPVRKIVHQRKPASASPRARGHRAHAGRGRRGNQGIPKANGSTNSTTGEW